MTRPNSPISPRLRPWLTTNRLAMIGACVLTLYLTFITVRDLLGVLLIAAALSSLLLGFHDWLTRKLSGHRGLAAALIVFLLFVVILVPLSALAAVVIQQLISEVSQASVDWRPTVANLHLWLSHFGRFGRPLEPLVKQLAPKITDAAPALAQHAAIIVASIGSTLVNLTLSLFLMALAVYYFLVDGPGIRDRILRLLPLPSSDSQLFLRRFREVSVAVVLGNLGTALGQGLFATIGYLLFGAPLPFLWGAATAVAALVPMLGTSLVWVPLALVVGAHRGWIWGGGLVGYSLVMVGLMDNVLRPILTRRGLEIHPLAIFIAVFGGLAAFGVAGLFFGPLVIALFLTVLDIYDSHLRLG